ncbi:MAG: PIG-L family deacetylase [Thermoanaerobaculia bacterium]
MALLIMILGVCESSAGRVRAVGSWQPRRILVVIAHPDDELLFAPYLGPRCAGGVATCSILLLTRGEAGGDPEVRAREIAASASLLGASLVSYAHPDIMAPWVERDTILREISEAVATLQPDTIFTFDPKHGTTGHPAHRETGTLVLATGARNVYLLETRAAFVGSGFVLWPSGEGVWSYDPGLDWNWAVRIAEIHASQFTSEQVESLRELPMEQRRVWLLRVR